MPADRIYRPSAFLRINIRLEDYFQAVEKDTPTEAKAGDQSEQVKRLNQEIGRLQKQLAQAQAPTGGPIIAGDAAVLRGLIDQLQQQVIRLQRSTSSRAVKEGPGDPFSVELLIVPIELNIELNGFRIADTLNASFPFRDAPLVSDIIRAAQVDAFMGTVPEESFADPANWLLPRNRAQIMFRGYVDTWDTMHDEGDSKVQIQCRSLESVLIDGKINPLAKAYRIDGRGEKISVYVNRILSQFPPTAGKSGGDQMKAAWYGADPAAEPVLDRKLLSRSLQTAKGRNTAQNPGAGDPPPFSQPNEGDTNVGQVEGSVPDSGGPPQGDVRMPVKTPGQEMSIWDLVSQACQLAGCLPTYDPSLPPQVSGNLLDIGFQLAAGKLDVINPLDTILLRPAQTIYEDVDGSTKIKGGPTDGFGREFSDPETGTTVASQLRFMVWGHNIKSMTTSRKLGRIKAPAIEVISYNPDAPPNERRLAARFPPNSAIRATRTGSKGEGKMEEVLTFQRNGVRDLKMLTQEAASLYNAMSRGEVSVKITTDDMASYIDPLSPEKHNDNPDLLKLRPGSPCRVTVAREQVDPGSPLVISPLSELYDRRSVETARFMLEQEGRFSKNATALELGSRPSAEEMAGRVATALASAKLTDVFYCKTVSHTFAADTGWSSTMELVNYLEARSDPRVLGEEARKIVDAAKLPKKRGVTTPARASDQKRNKAVERAYNASTQGKKR